LPYRHTLDITVTHQELLASKLSEDEKTALIQARQTLEALHLTETDKADVSSDLDKVTQELQQAKPDEGRLRRLLRNVQEIAPPVSSALSIAASIHKLITG
jgi:hypothetical protein